MAQVLEDLKSSTSPENVSRDNKKLNNDQLRAVAGAIARLQEGETKSAAMLSSEERTAVLSAMKSAYETGENKNVKKDNIRRLYKSWFSKDLNPQELERFFAELEETLK